MPRDFTVNPIINGILEPIRSSIHETYDPQRGIVKTEEWRGVPNLRGGGLDGLAKQFRDNRVAYEYYDVTGLRPRIITSANSGQGGLTDITADTWQLLATEVSLSILRHPRSIALTNAQLQAVLQAVEDFNGGGSPSTAGFSADALSLYDHLIHGIESYITTQYVMRHTTSVSNGYNENVADENVDAIYSFDQLESEVTNAGYWTFPMPGRLLAKMNTLQATLGAAPTGYTLGWRKTASTETTAANNRIDISTEYQLGFWSNFLYSAAVFF